MEATPDAPESLVNPLWSDPDGLIRRGEILKDGDRCTVVALDAGGRRYVLKRYNLKDVLHTAVHTLMRSRARWCFGSSARMISRGFLTPLSVAMLEERWGLLRFRSYLLTEWVEGEPLDERARRQGPSELAPIAAEMGALWRALGDARIGHGDMKASNFLIDVHGRVWMIDLDGVRFALPPGLFERQRRQDRWCLLRNFDDRPEVKSLFESALDASTEARHPAGDAPR